MEHFYRLFRLIYRIPGNFPDSIRVAKVLTAMIKNAKKCEVLMIEDPQCYFISSLFQYITNPAHVGTSQPSTFDQLYFIRYMALHNYKINPGIIATQFMGAI